MKRFTRWLAARLIDSHQNVNDLKVRARYGALEGWVSIAVNAALFVIKIVVGTSIASVSLHIEVSDKESVLKAHTLSEAVQEKIARKTGGTVVVHIDPMNRDHPQYASIARAITEIVANDARVHSFHEPRIIGCDSEKCNVVFDVTLEENVDEQESYDIIRSVQRTLENAFPRMKTIVRADPKYAYSA